MAIVGWQATDGGLGFAYDGVCSVPGDSGGPMVWPTDYGNIAVGIVRGGTTVPGVGQLCFGTNMLDISWVLGAEANSLTTGP